MLHTLHFHSCDIARCDLDPSCSLDLIPDPGTSNAMGASKNFFSIKKKSDSDRYGAKGYREEKGRKGRSALENYYIQGSGEISLKGL